MRWLVGAAMAFALTACTVFDRADGPVPRCSDEPAGPIEVEYRSADGVPANQLSLDVYLPEGCGPFPVVMWVHGGGWVSGDKRNAVAVPKIALARSLGAALVSVNYRLKDPLENVPWPGNAEDLAAAIGWVTDSGPDYNLDPQLVSAIGHSAGAHLISIVATDPQFLRGADVSEQTLECVVSVDSTAYNMPASSTIEQVLIYRAFGDDLDVLSEASPLVAVRTFGAPAADFLVVARGSQTRVAAQQQFVDEINAVGGQATLVNVNPYDHSEAGWQVGVPGEELVTPVVRDFLLGCQSEGAAGDS